MTLALVPVSTAVTGALSEVVSTQTIFAVAGCIPIVAAFIAVVAARRTEMSSSTHCVKKQGKRFTVHHKRFQYRCWIPCPE